MSDGHGDTRLSRDAANPASVLGLALGRRPSAIRQAWGSEHAGVGGLADSSQCLQRVPGRSRGVVRAALRDWAREEPTTVPSAARSWGSALPWNVAGKLGLLVGRDQRAEPLDAPGELAGAVAPQLGGRARGRARRRPGSAGRSASGTSPRAVEAARLGAGRGSAPRSGRARPRPGPAAKGLLGCAAIRASSAAASLGVVGPLGVGELRRAGRRAAARERPASVGWTRNLTPGKSSGRLGRLISRFSGP